MGLETKAMGLETQENPVLAEGPTLRGWDPCGGEVGVFPAERRGGRRGEAFPAGASSEQVTGSLAVIRPPGSQVYDGFLWQAWKLPFFFFESQAHKSITYIQIKSSLMMGFTYPGFKLKAGAITLQCTCKTHALCISAPRH